MSCALQACMDGSKPPCSSRHFGVPTGNFNIFTLAHLLKNIVRRCRVVKQHDMFQENFEHVPRILFARSCVLVGVFFRELL